MSNQKTTTLSKSNNYKNVQLLPAGMNRTVMQSHVSVLSDSIDTHGVLRFPVIFETDIFAGTKTYYLADGQHLMTAVMMKGLSTRAIVYTKPINDLDDIIRLIADLNNTSKGWTLKDFLYIWKNTNKDSYAYLAEKYESTVFSIYTILDMYSTAVNTFKTGRLSLKGKKKNGDTILDTLIKLNREYSQFKNTHVARGFIGFYKALDFFNYSRFVKILDKNKEQFLKIKSKTEVRQFFEEKYKV